jgi:predicted PurR-regulated permease PerM
MSLHPAISVAAIIIGGTILGGIGIILALPVAAIIQAVISTSIHRHEVVARSTRDVASD